MDYPKVYAITLSYNRKEDTIECIESLKKMKYPNFKILVVENGSTDDSLQAIKNQFPDISVIEIKNNVGYARGFNTGLKYAYENGAEYFLILNNDTVVDPYVLNALVRVAERDDSVGFVSGKVYFYDQPEKLQTVGRRSHPILLVHELVGREEHDHGQYDEMKEYDFLDDIFLLVRKRAYEDTGGYDPNFFLYYEETDWCARVRRAGYKLVYTPEAKIWHKHGKTTGGDNSVTFVYYTARNQILFMRRNSPPGHFVRYLRYLTARSPRRMARWVKHRRFDLLSAYVRGIISGILWLIRDGKRANTYISPQWL